MRRLRTYLLLGVFCLTRWSYAEEFIFVAQKDENGVLNSSWFDQSNWFVRLNGQLASASTLPQEYDTAVITGGVDVGDSTIRIDTLVLTNSAAVTNGNFGTLTMQM